MKTFSTTIVALLALTACDSPEPSDELETSGSAGKADVVDADDEEDIYFVFSNGVTCFTAPCPSVTAVGPDGERIELADVILPEELSENYEGLYAGGLAVTGEVIEGSWDPLEAGTVLEVSDVVGFAQDHLVVDRGLVCITAPCPTHEAIAADDTRLPIAGVDVALDAFGSENDAALRNQVMNSEVVARGWVRPGSWDISGQGNTLIVTQIVLGIADYEVSTTGIVCITAPCPWLQATSAEGTTSELASVNPEPLGLDEEARDEFINSFLMGETVVVRGWIAEGSWAPFGPGTILHALDLPATK
jgi:hypothetical protein